MLHAGDFFLMDDTGYETGSLQTVHGISGDLSALVASYLLTHFGAW